MKPHIYLAGPIAGCTRYEANDWREEMCGALNALNMVGVSPLRCEPIHGERYALQYDDPMFGSPRAISSKNVLDVKRCDLTLAYFPSDGAPSVGTLIELAWAHAFGKPTVLMTGNEAVRAHPLVQACAGWVLEDIDDVVELIRGIFSVYS